MLPFERFTVKLKGGDHGVLVNPHQCGNYTVTSQLTPWKSAPDFPAGDNQHPSDNFAASFDGAWRPAPTRSRSTRPSAARRIPACRCEVDPVPEPGRSWTATSWYGRSRPRSRRDSSARCLESRSAPSTTPHGGTCSDNSKVGSVNTTVGSGGDPLPLPGSIYLAQPLQSGDPASLSIVVPAKAGPFDFGNVDPCANRPARRLRARRRARGRPAAHHRGHSDPYAHDRCRDRQVELHAQPDVVRTAQLGATFTSREGTQATATAPYQATNCSALLLPGASLRGLRRDEEGRPPDFESDGHAGVRSGEHREVTRRSAGRHQARHRRALPPGALSARRRSWRRGRARRTRRSAPRRRRRRSRQTRFRAPSTSSSLGQPAAEAGDLPRRTCLDQARGAERARRPQDRQPLRQHSPTCRSAPSS